VPITTKSAETALGFARALINSSQLPLLLFDGDTRVVFASPSFHHAFDVPWDGVEGRTLAEIGPGWDILQLNILLESALSDSPQMSDYETDLLRPSMRPRRLLVNARSIVGAPASEIRILMTITDVTRVRDIEGLNVALLMEKDSLLRERAILLDEMQHRIANSLQIIASVLLLKARAVKSEETRLHLHDAHNRVMSLAAVQQHLQFTLGEVEVGPYLTKLCGSLAASMISEARAVSVDVRCDDAVLPSREAVSLGLVVTELVINALKHAFPDGREGRIEVHYHVTPEGWSLSVADDGVGMPDDSSAKAGLGSSIVQGLAKQLGAGVRMADAGPGLRVSLVTAESAAES
jgi:two-component sensor histidine kinase